MISVIIPLYNKAEIVARSIQSVLSQSYKDFELIVVDDGSTDDSYDIVENIHDSRIRLIHQENGGPSKARNTGVHYAKGDWIVFLDADDELLPGTLKRYSITINKQNNADIIACPFFCDNGKERLLKYKFKTGWLNNSFKAFYLGDFFICSGSFICKRRLLFDHPFNESIRRYEDFEVWFRLFKDSKIFTTSEAVLIVNCVYSNASRSRQNINEDFLGHMNFKGKSFWEKMCLYKLYLWERDYYSEECDKLYPLLRWRFDLLLLHKTLHFLKSYHFL